MQIDVKMSTIVGILPFICRINFEHSRAEYEKSFVTPVPGFKLFAKISGSLRKQEPDALL